MEQFQYTCHYCSRIYIPKKRKKQKYCSNSCRTRAFQLRNPKLGSTVSTIHKKPESVKIDKISSAGVGNAIVGSLIADGVGAIAKSFFQNEEDKPATKKDIALLSKAIAKERYVIIENLPSNHNGTKPYFDIQTRSIVYLNPIQSNLLLKK